MKNKVLSITICLLLSLFTLSGCLPTAPQDDVTSPEITTPKGDDAAVSPSETSKMEDSSETEEPTYTGSYFKGRILAKISPDILMIESTEMYNYDFGNTVYVYCRNLDEWCVGDIVDVIFSQVELPYDTEQYATLYPDKIELGDWPAPEKPIIYLYPETEILVSLKVSIDGKLTCTYPEHGDDGWQNFTAYPDGTLISPEGKEYYALYWEGIQNTEWNFSEGWCVRGEDTAAFLEWALDEQGLTPREANEFIVYWLPRMQGNAFNVISFQTTAYTDTAILEINPSPDSLIRVFMAYYATDTRVEIEPQVFDKAERQGFTIVEWGGSQVERP